MSNHWCIYWFGIKQGEAFAWTNYGLVCSTMCASLGLDEISHSFIEITSQTVTWSRCRNELCKFVRPTVSHNWPNKFTQPYFCNLPYPKLPYRPCNIFILHGSLLYRLIAKSIYKSSSIIETNTRVIHFGYFSNVCFSTSNVYAHKNSTT